MQALIGEIVLPRLRKAWVAPVCAAIAMALSCLGAWWLDTLHKKPKPPMSTQLEVQQQLAAAELHGALGVLKAARESEVELKRQQADIWLEFAGVKSDPDGGKNAEGGANAAGSAMTVELRQKKLARLDEARLKIEELYASARGDVVKMSRTMDGADFMDIPKDGAASTGTTGAAVYRTAARPADAPANAPASPNALQDSSSFTDYLFDEKNALYYIYRALLIGMVIVFSYCGLYLLYRLAKAAGVNFDMVKNIDPVLETADGSGRRALATLPAMLFGSAALAGGALAVGSAMGGGNAPQIASATHSSSVTRWGDAYKSEQNNLTQGSLSLASSPLTVDLAGQKLALDLQGQKLAVQVPEPGNWTGMFDRFFGTGSPLAGKLESTSANFLSAAEAFRSSKDAGPDLKKLADQQKATAANLESLTKSVMYVDCNLQRAAAVVLSASVHNGYADEIRKNLPGPCTPPVPSAPSKTLAASR